MTSPATTVEVPRGKRSPAPPAEAPPPAKPAAAFTAMDVQMVAIADISPGDNVRSDPGDVAELQASIEQVGVLEPIKVQPAGKGYRLVWGQRRLAAATLAGLTEIPAIIDGAKPNAERAATEQLIENIQRQDLNAIDEAKALRKILDGDKKLSQQDLAIRLGRSESWLSNRLRLLGLDEGVQEKIAAGEITESHGKAIASLPAAQQREMAQVIKREGTSTKDVERELEWKRQQAETDEARARKTEKTVPKVIAALEAAGVPKGAPVHVVAYGFDKLEPGIKKAGWDISPIYAHEIEQGCKCNAWRVDVDGRTIKVVKACIADHWRRESDREQNASRQAQAAAEKEAKATLDKLRAAMIESLIGNPPAPTIMRLMTWTAGNWPRPTWADLAKLGQGELVAKLVARLTDYQMRDLQGITAAGLLAELTGQAVGQATIDEAAAAPAELAADDDLTGAAAAVFGDDIASITEEPAAPATEQVAQVEQAPQVEQPLAARPATPAPKGGKAGRKGKR